MNGKEKRDELRKEVIHLYYDGESPSEIGFILGIAESLVRSILAE